MNGPENSSSAGYRAACFHRSRPVLDGIDRHMTASEPRTRIYNLARYEGEMREALTRWADYVEALVSEALPQSVGPLPGEAPRPKRLVRGEG